MAATVLRYWIQHNCARILRQKSIHMKNTVFLFLFLFCVLTSCRTIRPADFHTHQRVAEPLPRLKTLIHARSFAEAFDYALDRDYAYSTAGPNPWLAVGVTNQAMSDVSRLLQNELEENINSSSSTVAGNARFKLVTYERRHPGWGFIFPTIATMGAANLLGMPFGVTRVELELQMEITDTAGNTIVTYTAPGRAKAAVAMYYGYDAVDATRKANLTAIKKAMGAIKQAMGKDTERTTARLQVNN